MRWNEMCQQVNQFCDEGPMRWTEICVISCNLKCLLLATAKDTHSRFQSRTREEGLFPVQEVQRVMIIDGAELTPSPLRPASKGCLGIWEHAAGAVLLGIEAFAPGLVDFGGQNRPGSGKSASPFRMPCLTKNTIAVT